MKRNANSVGVLAYRFLLLLLVSAGVSVLIGKSMAGALACDTDTVLDTLPVDNVKAFFRDQKKTVLTFIGYSGAEYEDQTAMLEQAAAVLDEFDPQTTLVNIGATVDGIGAVYEIAKQKGFATTGIVSTQAKKYDGQISPCVDHVFFIEDSTWGGYLANSSQLAPTSATLISVTDVFIGIGGGEIGRDEMLEAQAAGKEVRFFPADMNHRIAIEKAEKKGLPAPIDFSGAADAEF